MNSNKKTASEMTGAPDPAAANKFAAFGAGLGGFGSTLKKKAEEAGIREEMHTPVGVGMFDCPVDRIGVSGGTAPFFSLVLSDDYQEGSKSANYYIGKDLSRATDELEFYEKLFETKGSRTEFFEPLLNFAFEYKGVLTTQERIDGIASGEDLQLLVLRNLFDGKKSLRLLDLKIGEATSAKNWQGKSAIRNRKQKVVDSGTNSKCEGFRLEGFESMPDTLKSREPLLDTYQKIQNKTNVKKMRKIQLQSMKGREILMHFLDLHLEKFKEEEDQMKRSEYLEILLHEFVLQLTKLFVSCQNLPVPQMWIGSSIALGFDSGNLPSRLNDHDEIRKSVLVKIFDWGRSELNTMETYAALSSNDQNRRNKYWNFYKKGIAKLAWNASLEYKSRFGTKKWLEIVINIMDFDALSKDDFLGRITIPVEETPEKTLKLENKSKSTFTYSISWHPLDDSRLYGVWKVRIVGARSLQNKDFIVVGCSDPYCMLTARAEGTQGEFENFKQCTTVKPNVLNPVWNEEFELPVSPTTNGYLYDALTAGGLDLPDESCNFNNLDDLFGCADGKKALASKTQSLERLIEIRKKVTEKFAPFSE